MPMAAIHAQELQDAVHGEVGAQLSAVVEKYAAAGFSGYVVVRRGENVLLARGAGFRNRTKRLPNTPDTWFEIGSLAKPFTALAVLLLQEDGKLDIHEPAKRYLPEIPEAYAEVT
jgi:CubicO group peptidase (beta-lactamase class C family)